MWNASVKALGDYLTGKPLFYGYQAAAQSITNATFVSATIDTEIVDTEGGHSNTTNSSRYIFQVPGWYRLDGVSAFTTNTTGIRGTKFLKNGATSIVGSENIIPATNGFLSITPTSGWVQAAVGDYVELQVYQSSGATLATSSNAGLDYVTSMRIEWISN
ncbi:hypothetical protein [Streptomyces sp. BBFR109]|uniref:hypothetical protein n=1 Tax=Streptomyces sp. BBFR109 TaxID=3448172 RepID=UPI003F759163